MGYPYGPPPGHYGGYGYQQQVPEIPSYKGWAIFTLFCGFVFGVAALAKANEVEMARQRGDFPRAWQASKSVKALCVIGNVFGLLAYTAFLAWIIILVS
ncbi:CD225/dispanin family protein [Amycolatopsis acidicola]|uniref:CD225/dispanin family protein n=1 Tax=Amycolatopsis acidicola TaxID=2596893 RepID=A0A5N0V240_9PSEU|nr:CD225/dispanin family protein [Amycolatopsis acidicola]KAA9159828.1 CD225/dispanin family protein [Amycolatopsis acidicola]